MRGDDSNVVRGRGLARRAAVRRRRRRRIYEAAVRGAFEVDDESLSLLLDSRELPRGVGLRRRTRLSDSVAAELRRRGVTEGACEPPLTASADRRAAPPTLPGYVVRFSPVFALRGDSVQVYVYVQKYDNADVGPSQTLRFERAYQVVRTATSGGPCARAACRRRFAASRDDQ